MKINVEFITYYVLNGDTIIAGPFGKLSSAERIKDTYKPALYPNLTIGYLKHKETI